MVGCFSVIDARLEGLLMYYRMLALQLRTFVPEWRVGNDTIPQLVYVSPFFLRQSSAACNLLIVVPRLKLPHHTYLVIRRALFKVRLFFTLNYYTSALHPQQ